MPLESTINLSGACIKPTFLRGLRTRHLEKAARRRPTSDTEITKVMKVNAGSTDNVPTRPMRLARTSVRAKTLRGAGTVCGREASYERGRELSHGRGREVLRKRGARPAPKTYEVAQYNPVNNPIVMERDVVFRVVQSAATQAISRQEAAVARERNAAASDAYLEIAIEVEIDVSEFECMAATGDKSTLLGRLARFSLAVLALLGFVGLNLSFA